MSSMSRSQILVAMAVTAVVLLVIAKAWMYFFEVSLVPFSFSWLYLGIGLGLGMGIAALSSLIYEIWPSYREAANSYLDTVLTPLEMTDLLWLGLLPGMSEELLFRGVALPGFGMDLTALIASSTIFGLLHMVSLKHWPYTVWAGLVGLMLGSVTLATNSLLPAIAAHILTNSLSGLLWKLKHKSASSEP